MQKITARGLTDVGMKRAHNEDYFGIDEELGLYVVCDGMGGHASGEVASRIACENIFSFVRERYQKPKSDLPYAGPGLADYESLLLSNAVQYANDRVFIEGMKDAKLEGMGTTLVAMMLTGERMVLAHVGDSRIYRYTPSKSKIELLTRDHSLLNHMIDRGELTTEEERRNFKQGNVIVRAVGLKDEVEPEVQSVVVGDDDVFLLCSDGLSDLVDDWALENVLIGNSGDLEEAASMFIRMANDRGGKDNITALLVRVDGLRGATTEEVMADEHVTQPTLPKVDLAAGDLAVPEWMDDDDAPLYDDSNEWPEVNDYADALPAKIDPAPEPPAAALAEAVAAPPVVAATALELGSLEVPEQVALIVLAKALVVADGEISMREMEHLNELSAAFGQAVFQRADNAGFGNEQEMVSFLGTVSRPEARDIMFRKLLAIAESDALLPTESAILEAISRAWSVPLPGTSPAPTHPPIPSDRRAAQVTAPAIPVPSSRRVAAVGQDGVARKLPSIIIDDDMLD